MLFTIILAVFFGIADLLILILLGIMGNIIVLPDWAVYFEPIINTALFFVPIEIFAVIIAHVMGWFMVNLIWGITHFVIRKIPGVS